MDSVCVYTCEQCLVAAQQYKVVHEWREDALHGAEHGGHTQVQEHEEKQCWPEWAPWEERHGLGECYKCQSSPFHSLSKTNISVAFSTTY